MSILEGHLPKEWIEKSKEHFDNKEDQQKYLMYRLMVEYSDGVNEVIKPVFEELYDTYGELKEKYDEFDSGLIKITEDTTDEEIERQLKDEPKEMALFPGQKIAMIVCDDVYAFSEEEQSDYEDDDLIKRFYNDKDITIKEKMKVKFLILTNKEFKKNYDRCTKLLKMFEEAHKNEQS